MARQWKYSAIRSIHVSVKIGASGRTVSKICISGISEFVGRCRNFYMAEVKNTDGI